MSQHQSYPSVSLLKFSNLCTGFDRLAAVPPSQKKPILEKLWATFGHSSKSMEPRQNLFPLMRLLMPEIDEERGNYRLKQQSLGEVYIDVIGVSPDSKTGQTLKNFTKPSKSVQGVGDFFTVLEGVLKSYARPSQKPSAYTIAQINDFLDSLVRAPNKADQIAVFRRLLTELTPKEHMWLGRIIVKDMKLGMKPETMLKEFYPNAVESFRMCSSLHSVCDAVTDPLEFSKIFSTVQVGSACKPMLAASTGDWKLILTWLDGIDFIVEDKYDGERLMIHKNGSDIKLFSRNSFDLTERWKYGEGMKKAINAALPAVSVAILDGELMSWNKETKAFMPFGTNRPTSRSDDTHVDLCFICFDLLFLDGESWLSKPLLERKKKLATIVKPTQGLFELIGTKFYKTAEERQILDCLDEALDKGREGIIIKQANSEYKLGDRGREWIKLKPDMIKGLHDTLDVIVLGAYYGSGSRAGNVYTFLVGVAERHPPGKMPEKFFAFGKVGTGYSREELANLREQLGDKFIKYDERRPPSHWVKWKPEHKDKPDFWIKPEDSIILEVKCFEVTECRVSKFVSGYTWRFPRVVRTRTDKPWYDCLTIEEAEEMARTDRVRRRTADVVGLRGDDLEKETMSSTFDDSLLGTLDPNAWSSLSEVKPEKTKQEKKSPSKRGLKRNRGNDGVSLLFKPTDVSKVVTKSRLFDGLSFCILTVDPPPAPTKRKLEKLIAENGGTFTALPMATTKYLFASRNESWVVSVEKKSGKHDILHWSWLMDSCQQQQVIPSITNYQISLTPTTMAALEHEVDEWGDSFVTDITPSELKKLLQPMEGVEINPAVLPELESLQNALRSNSEVDLFSGLIACPPRSDGKETKQQKDALRLGTLAFRAHGGRMLERNIDVDDDELMNEVMFLVDDASKYPNKRRVFDWRWVERCIQNKTVHSLDN